MSTYRHHIFMIAALVASVSQVAYSQSVTRGPYLQSLSDSSVIVCWRTDQATASYVRYGTNVANRSSVASNPAQTTEHEVLITGLSPETVYYYDIGDGPASVLAGGAADFHIKTHPVPGSVRDFRIWAIGDFGTQNADQARVRDAYYALAGGDPTDVWLMLGDIAYNDGFDDEFQAAIFDVYPTLLRNTSAWCTRGNHERQADVYYDTFRFPTAGEAGGLPSGTETYYSFDYGQVHFVCLESSFEDLALTNPMWTWLQNDLAATAQEFIIAFWHHPPYTKGSHDSDTEGRLIRMRNNALPILEAAGVDLVLTGHSHSYERSYQIHGHYGVSSSFDPVTMLVNGGDGRLDGDGAYVRSSETNGAVYIVAGSSGKVSSTIPDQPNWHSVMFDHRRELGSVVIDAHPSRLDVGFLTDLGVMSDHFSILHPEAPSPFVVAKPATLPGYDQATLNGELLTGGTNLSRVVLVYDTVDQGATTSGWSNVVSLGDMTLGTFDHVVTGLVSETDYVYRFHAVNASGEHWSEPVTFRTVSAAPVIRGVIDLREGLGGATDLIPWDAVWRYYDQGSEPNGNWTAFNYNDGDWSSGKAELGYGDGDEATVVSYGPKSNDKYVTTYFRHTLSLDRPEDYSDLQLKLRRDDGAIVYVNGTEVHRSNLDAGNIQYGDYANALAVNDGNDILDVPIGSLEAETVIAAEIHQRSASNPDLTFAMRLFGDAAGENTFGARNVTYGSAEGAFLLASEGLGPTTVTLYYGTTDGGTDTNGWDNTVDLGAYTHGETAYTTMSGLLSETTYYYRYRATNASGESWTGLGSFTTTSSLPLIEHTITNLPPTNLTLVAAGSVWKYLDNGSDQGTAWRATAFNDSGWASGPAELGYGDGDEATVVNSGPVDNKYPTTYFRRTIDVVDAANHSNLELQLRRDDGAIVYLNGVEVVRNNMPSDPITYLTYSAGGSGDDGNTWFSFPVGAGFQEGPNTIAVEIHNVSPTSSDISFDLSLSADYSPPASATNVTIDSAGVGAELLNVGQGPTTIIVYYGTSDGGTNSTAWEDNLFLGARPEGPVDAVLTGLRPETDYYYRYFAINSVGSDWASETYTFRTADAFAEVEQDALVPTAQISFATATIDGDLLRDSGYPAEVDVFYGITDGGTNAAAWSNSVSIGVQAVGPISAALSGLTDATTYYVRFRATNTNGEDWASATTTFVTLDGTPVIRTQPPSGVGTTTATANGDLLQDGDVPTTVRVYHGTTDGGTNAAAWDAFVDAGTGAEGAYPQLLSGLDDAATHYYRYFAFNTHGSAWSSASASFTTIDGSPIIDTLATTDVQTTSATVGGDLLHDGDTPTTIRLHYGTTDGGTNAWEQTIIVATGLEAVYPATMSDLLDDTTYFYRFSASNTYGSAWATGTLSFTTLDGTPAVQTVAASDVTVNSATVSGDLLNDGDSATTVTLYWGASDGGTNDSAWAQSTVVGTGSEGLYTENLTGLTPNTTYFIRHTASNEFGLTWSPATFSFTTGDPTPAVESLAATNVFVDHATANAQLSEDGGVPTTVRIYYGTSDGGTTNWDAFVDIVPNIGVGDYPYELTGLANHTTYYYRHYAYNSYTNTWSPTTISFTTLDGAAQIESHPATAVDVTSATANGALVDPGLATVSVSLYYGSTDGGTNAAAWAESIDLGALPVGPIQTELSGLLPDGPVFYRYRATNAYSEVWSDPQSFTTLSGAPRIDNFADNGTFTVTAIPFDADWRYLDDGSDQGTAWRATAFADHDWASGPAELGYGQGDEATVVSFGPSANDKHITTWFRHGFVIDAAPLIQTARFSVVRDDGVAVYLDGTEAHRSLLAPDATYTTTATSAAPGQGYPALVDSLPVAVENGPSSVAAEIHQASPNSSDISFNLQLELLGAQPAAVVSVDTTTASLRGVLLNEGAGDTSVLLYYGLGDGGADPFSWESSKVLGTRSEGEVQAVLTNLVPATTYFFRFYALNPYGQSMASSTLSFTTDALPGGPSISQPATLDPAFIGITNATVQGVLEYDNGVPTTVTVYYGPSDGGTNAGAWASSLDLGITPTGEVDTVLSGLQDDSTYVYRLFASNSFGGAWSAFSTAFTTPDGSPVITNAPATAVGTTNATANAELLDRHGVTTAVQVYWGTTDGGTNAAAWEDSGTLGAPTEGPLSMVLTGLNPGTAYYYRFFATNTVGSAWGAPTITFTTVGDGPIVSTGTASNITTSSATATGTLVDDGALPTTVRLYYGTSDGGTDAGSWSSFIDLGISAVGPLATALPGLSPNTTYYYRHFASNALDIAWAPGSVSFTTASPAVEIVAHAATDLTASGATANGEILQSGGQAGTAILYYGTSDAGANAAAWEDSVTLANVGVGPVSAVLTNLAAGTYFYRWFFSGAGDSDWSDTAASFTIAATTPVLSHQIQQDAGVVDVDEVVVPPGWVWRYLDDGSNQGTAWSAAGFDDSAWPLGFAQFGYGDGDEATVVDYGPDPSNKHVTTYFRTSFQVEDRTAVDFCKLRLKQADGAIVYLNGFQVHQVNLPLFGATYTTLASTNDTATEDIFVESIIGPGFLVDGENVLAVEIHQSALAGADISFDLEWIHSSQEPAEIYPDVTVSGSTAFVSYRLDSDGGAPTTQTVFWGTTDGGTDPAAWANAFPLGPLPVGEHEAVLDGLTLGTRYYYRILAENSAGAAWSDGPAWFSTTDPDSDGDGMTDAWEVTNFGDTTPLPDDDADTDGQSNLAEELAGTDPNDPDSRLLLLTEAAPAGDRSLGFHTKAGTSYLLEHCPELPLVDWSIDALVHGDGAWFQRPLPGTDPEVRGFYRVSILKN